MSVSLSLAALARVFAAGRANVPKKELQERIQKLFKVKDAGQVIPFAFRTAFGGGKSTGMVNVYNSLDEAKKFTQGHILVRLGLKDKKEKKGRKGKKEAKNRQLKIRGVGRRTARKKAKRADK